MKDWKRALVRPDDTILHAVGIIDAEALQIVFVTNEDGKFLGTITDGDIRRGILKGYSMQDPVTRVMNSRPFVAKIGDSRAEILAVMKTRHIRHIPILDENGCIVRLESLDDLVFVKKRDNPVLLMAGGLGTRLRPLTNDCPKPLLSVGNKPILETIINGFMNYGFWNFYVAVNYKSEMIEQYFMDGSQWGVQIKYIREPKRSGTAGALSQLPEQQEKPVIVMNGDLLTKVNFDQLLAFHSEHDAKATLCVREYEMQIPYGVVDFDKWRLNGIEEKPIKRYFVSAGIYVLSPEAVSLVPMETYYDMPDLFREMIQRKMTTAVFPIREYWMDIGQMKDFEQAALDYSEVFHD